MKFKFEKIEGGRKVKRGKKELGTIVAQKEGTGRHCFSLGFDKRKTPRTYRGRQKAAEALCVIDQLKSKKRSPEQLILEAWDAKPRASEQG